MTARSHVIGKHPDGFVNRYGLEANRDIRLLHVIATRTGKLAFCGYRATAIIAPPLSQAVAIERREDSRSKGFEFCRECLESLTPQPDPVIWGPPRPSQR